MVADELFRRGLGRASERSALLEPPGGRRLVEGADVELVDDERGVGLRSPASRLSDGSSGSTWWSEVTAIAASNGPALASRSSNPTCWTFGPRGSGSMATTSYPSATSARASSPSPAPISSSRAGGAGRFERTNSSRSAVGPLTRRAPVQPAADAEPAHRPVLAADEVPARSLQRPVRDDPAIRRVEERLGREAAEGRAASPSSGSRRDPRHRDGSCRRRAASASRSRSPSGKRLRSPSWSTSASGCGSSSCDDRPRGAAAFVTCTPPGEWFVSSASA